MVILARKFLLAACTLLLRENPRFQVTVALAMLFTFFCLQVRYKPYMMRSALPLQVMIEKRAEHDRKAVASKAQSQNNEENYTSPKLRKRLSVNYEDSGSGVAAIEIDTFLTIMFRVIPASMRVFLLAGSFSTLQNLRWAHLSILL